MKKYLFVIILLSSNHIFSQEKLDGQINKARDLYQDGRETNAIKIWKQVEKQADHASGAYGATLENLMYHYLKKNDEKNVLDYYQNIITSQLNDRDPNLETEYPYKNYRYHATTTLASYYGQNGNYEKALSYVEIADNDLKFETNTLQDYRYQKVNLSFWKYQLLKDLGQNEKAVSKLIKRAFEYDYQTIFPNSESSVTNADELELAETICKYFDKLQTLKSDLDTAIENLSLDKSKKQIQLTIVSINYIIDYHSELETKEDSKAYLKNSYFYKYLTDHAEKVIFIQETKKIKNGLTVKEKNIMLESTLKGEFYNQEALVKKWNRDVLVFLKNPENKILVSEFEKIVKEINTLSASISIKRVFEESEANYVILFSNRQTFEMFEPSVSDFLDDNFGFFTLNYNDIYNITRGCMYVDIERIMDIDCQKHILREELTQSLGITADHDADENSIFYSDWTCTTKYSELDKKIIRIFLDPEVKAGMTENELKNYLNRNVEE